MNRVNFAHCSHVVVNVCAQARDLVRPRRTAAHRGVHPGGRIGQERARRKRPIWSGKRRAAEGYAVPLDIEDSDSIFSPGANYGHWKTGIGAAAVFLRLLLRR
jgi:hypothetical protein